MCLFVCWLLAVARLQCTWDHTKTVILWDHTKTVILTGVSVCVLACMLVGLLWVDSSVSEITQKQWFSEITQKQWFFTGLSVCLLVGLLWLGSSASEITQTIFGQILWDHWKKPMIAKMLGTSDIVMWLLSTQFSPSIQAHTSTWAMNEQKSSMV